MRKILLALTGFLCLSTVLFSQRMVTGNVTSAEDGVSFRKRPGRLGKDEIR
jgi:hypothetical protein